MFVIRVKVLREIKVFAVVFQLPYQTREVLDLIGGLNMFYRSNSHVPLV